MRSIRRPVLTLPDLQEKTVSLIAEWQRRSDASPFNPTFQASAWRAARVLGGLLAMHGRVCAYCQGHLTPSDRGDVEHFRPKSVYWWLAYDFENYLLSCARCNRVRKGKHFPLVEGETRLAFGDARTVRDERRLLLDPTFDTVEDRVKIKRQGTTWILVPNKTNGIPDAEAVETIRFFELNLGEIPGARQRAISMALVEARRVRDEGADPSRLKLMASRFSPYGIFVRRILGRSFSDLLPTAIEETRNLVSDARVMLSTYDDTLANEPNHEDTLKLRETALWALAIIWNDPPDGISKGDISRWLGNRHRPEVKTMLEQL